MTAAERKKYEELTINIKCIISGLMTDLGLTRIGHQTSILISCCCQADCIFIFVDDVAGYIENKMDAI